jgi:hypothetical protein
MNICYWEPYGVGACSILAVSEWQSLIRMAALIGFPVLFLVLTVCSVVKLTWSLVFAQNV